MKYFFTIVTTMFMALTSDCFAQDFYYGDFSTKESKFLISGEIKNDSFQVQGSSVFIKVNNETGALEIRLPVSGLSANNMDVQKLIDTLKISLIEFKGSLGISKVETESHPVQRFPVAGEVTAGTLKLLLSGYGTLEHLHLSGGYACMLDLRFEIKLDRKYVPLPKELNENLKVIVLKSILRPVSGSNH
ncbi:MAG: hypothetical protein K2X86_15540 [Cytophagaceae bacterium]|nr:hypothetical protein [Cytophagaceae bacterium]